MLELPVEAEIIKKIAVLLVSFFLWHVPLFAQSTETEEKPALSRGSIPEDLLRPRREEALRYPVDTVIGPLGQGGASADAYAFARRVSSALTDGRMNDASLSTINSVMLESYLSALDAASPRSFRLGGGRDEADGSFSFLVRFIGREQSITGELFVRYEKRRQRPQLPAAEAAAADPSGEEDGEVAPNEAAAVETVAEPVLDTNPVWVFDELLLEEARSRKDENGEVKHRFDFSPYERFF